jgi:hypothetical protein
MEPKKDQWERDEILRSAWWLLFARAVGVERLVFLRTRWQLTSRFRRSTLGRAAGSREGTALAPLGQERHPACEHPGRESRALFGDRRTDDEGVYETYLERVLAPALHLCWTTSRPTKRQGEGDRRGRRMRARVPATILTRPQPHRAGLLEGQGTIAKDPSPHPCGADRSDGTGALAAVTARWTNCHMAIALS